MRYDQRDTTSEIGYKALKLVLDMDHDLCQWRHRYRLEVYDTAGSLALFPYLSQYFRCVVSCYLGTLSCLSGT